MRLFVALQLPEKTKDNLMRSSSQFAQQSSIGNFEPKTNYHVTLQFLGDVDKSLLPQLIQILNNVTNMPCPTLSVAKFEQFGQGTVVAKLTQDDNLKCLYNSLSQQLASAGFVLQQRKFVPHVTLGRHVQFELPFAEVIKWVDRFNKPFCASYVTLYQSIAKDTGMYYKPLHTVTLATD